MRFKQQNPNEFVPHQPESNCFDVCASMHRLTLYVEKGDKFVIDVNVEYSAFVTYSRWQCCSLPDDGARLYFSYDVH
jgi:hypothetical protein